MTDLKYLIEGEREEHLEKKIINTDSSSHLNISHERSSDYLVHIGSKLRMNWMETTGKMSTGNVLMRVRRDLVDLNWFFFLLWLAWILRSKAQSTNHFWQDDEDKPSNNMYLDLSCILIFKRFIYLDICLDGDDSLTWKRSRLV